MEVQHRSDEVTENVALQKYGWILGQVNSTLGKVLEDERVKSAHCYCFL